MNDECHTFVVSTDAISATVESSIKLFVAATSLSCMEATIYWIISDEILEQHNHALQ